MQQTTNTLQQSFAQHRTGAGHDAAQVQSDAAVVFLVASEGHLLGVELDSRPRVSERTPTACDEALWKLHSEPHTGSGLRVRVPVSMLGYISWVNSSGRLIGRMP